MTSGQARLSRLWLKVAFLPWFAWCRRRDNWPVSKMLTKLPPNVADIKSVASPVQRWTAKLMPNCREWAKKREYFESFVFSYSFLFYVREPDPFWSITVFRSINISFWNVIAIGQLLVGREKVGYPHFKPLCANKTLECPSSHWSRLLFRYWSVRFVSDRVG